MTNDFDTLEPQSWRRQYSTHFYQENVCYLCASVFLHDHSGDFTLIPLYDDQKICGHCRKKKQTEIKLLKTHRIS